MDPTLEASHSPTCLTSLIDIDRMLTVQILAALGQREGAASCLHNGSGWVTHCYHLQFFNIFQLCCMWYFGPGALACFFFLLGVMLGGHARLAGSKQPYAMCLSMTQPSLL